MGETLETKQKLPFVNTFTCGRDIFICKSVSLAVLEGGRMIFSLESLVNAENKDLNLHNNLVLIYCLCSSNLP